MRLFFDSSFIDNSIIMFDGTRFERKYVDLIIEEVERRISKYGKRHFNHSIFAKQAFKWEKDDSAVRKWRAMRNVSKTGEPQNLLLSEAVELAIALDLDFVRICMDVREQLKIEQTENPHANPHKNLA